MNNFEEKVLRILANEKKAISNQTLQVTATPQGLTVPNDATYALIQVQSSLDVSNLVRIWMDGNVPTATTGLSRGNLDVFDISEYSNLLKLRCILSAIAPVDTYLVIQYFS